MLLALTLFFGFTGPVIFLAEEEMPRPTDLEPIFI